STLTEPTSAGSPVDTTRVSVPQAAIHDLLIAGQALARGLTVVTANASEFGRVPGLKQADWAT
ncbi:MAG: hypothetical protein ACRDNW_04495, partial [Trebonia sp.]